MEIMNTIDPRKVKDVNRWLQPLGDKTEYTQAELEGLDVGWGTSRTQSDIGRVLEALRGEGGPITDPGFDIGGSPLFATAPTAAERQALESQYGQAGRRLVQQAGARGGQLLKAQMLLGQEVIASSIEARW